MTPVTEKEMQSSSAKPVPDASAESAPRPEARSVIITTPLTPRKPRESSGNSPRPTWIHRQTLKSMWLEVYRRLETRPNLSAAQVFDELRAQYPGRS
jgi:hypothetical protein